MTTRTPLWLDCDTGHDDAYALLLAAHDSNVELLGVSTVHGNASLGHTTHNTLAVLEALGRRNVPVYPGAAKPLTRDAVHAADIHGETGLDGVTLLPIPTATAITRTPFLDAMYTALKATPSNTAWLVSTGTLTNIALLFQTHPDIASHIKGLSIMGGAIGGGFTNAPMGKVGGKHGEERFGNWTAFAEFNIYCDPEAAQSIFSHPALRTKTTLIPLDLTHLVLATPPLRRALLHGPSLSKSPIVPPQPLRALYAQTLSFFAHTYATVFSLTAGPPLHDPLAVAAAIYPSLFSDNSGERYTVRVVSEGQHATGADGDDAVVGELGRTVVELVSDGEGVRIPRAVDVEAFWGLVEGAMGRAEGVCEMMGLGEGWEGLRGLEGLV